MAFLDVATELGRFSVMLRPDAAPVTCEYFASLARNGTFRDGSIFRIVSTSRHAGVEANPIDVVQVGTAAGMDEQLPVSSMSTLRSPAFDMNAGW